MALWCMAIGYLNIKLFNIFQSFKHNVCVFRILFQLYINKQRSIFRKLQQKDDLMPLVLNHNFQT